MTARSLIRILAAVSSAAAAFAAAAEPRLAVIQQSQRRVAFLDAESGAVDTYIPVGEGPHELALSPDGKTLVASNYGQMLAGNSVTFIDVTKGAAIQELVLGDYKRPHGMAFSPDGSKLYITTELNRCILVVDVATRSIDREIATDQGGSHMVALSPAGDRAYVANVHSGSLSIIDLEKNELVKNVPTRAGAEGVGVRPGGKFVWLANNQSNTVTVVDAESLEEVKTVDCDGFPLRVTFTPDGSRALVLSALSGEVVVYDADTIEEIGRIDTRLKHRPKFDAGGQSGNSPVPLSIAVSADGHRAYISCKAIDYVLIIDPMKADIVGDITVQGSPDGLVILPPAGDPPAEAPAGEPARVGA